MNNYSSTDDDAHFIVTDESKGLIQTLFMIVCLNKHTGSHFE